MQVVLAPQTERSVFECRFDDARLHSDEWRSVHAYDAEDAAVGFAEQSDQNSGEYSIASNGGCDADDAIEVRSPDGEMTKWTIRVESQIHYYADPLGD